MKFFLCFFVSLLILKGCKAPEHDEINIFLAGDSTIADKPYRTGNPEKGWGQVLPLYFNTGVRIQNHAVNGRSTKSFIDEGRWEVLVDQLKPGDYVFFGFGHNDAKSEDSTRYAAAWGDYTNNLIRFIDEVRSRQAIPVLTTSIVRRRFDGAGKLIETHGDYPDAVRRLAIKKDVVLIDLNQTTFEMVQRFGELRSKNLFLHIDTTEYTHLTANIVDDTHLSAYGAFKVADLVVAGIRDNFPELAKYLKK